MAFATMIQTPIGPFRVEADDHGVTRAEFNVPPIAAGATNRILDQLRAELAEYFAGQRTEFTVALNPSGTEFQKRVWNELLRIPFGETICYHELAMRIGKPTADRAVAQANGANPLCILIPCHRVIAKDGRMGGYSAGLERKRFLLGLEQGQMVDSKGFTLEVQECSC
jgi:methylated-DNA-[protein]-cysteine S-methyltransferase